ncbi:hypothetical protein MTE01_28660 [Microbacterium testaceum]|uniref:Uncharacterized protein n=1 Tax=Microbacterium testaceum TaxID=2033 RepID=A0A4Y3QP65_MICTE|nr:hypothetical protein [Microbacterium testaceum]GEB46921.1 hypothetical protein MTE01_28660 [Microbacterium testaceum]
MTSQRIETTVVVNTPAGRETITRTGTLTGEVSEQGMHRVQYDADGFGGMGWLKPGDFRTLVTPEQIALVVDDVRKSYEEFTEREAIAHVLDTLRLPEEPGCPGCFPIEEDAENPDELTAAYRAVLENREALLATL